jgi:hypothetical protein
VLPPPPPLVAAQRRRDPRGADPRLDQLRLTRRDARTDAVRGWRAHAEVKALARVLEGWILESASSDPARASRAAAHLEAALAQDLAEFPEAETLVRLTLAQLDLDRGELARARVHADRAWKLAQVTSGVGVAERERASALTERTVSTAQ